MRRDAKIDKNQPEIVAEFERMGAKVKSLAAVGDGFPDLIVALNGNHLVEVKGPNGKLRHKQIEFMESWPEPVHIVRERIDATALAQEWQEAKDG